jgi:hypothetical protein
MDKIYEILFKKNKVGTGYIPNDHDIKRLINLVGEDRVISFFQHKLDLHIIKLICSSNKDIDLRENLMNLSTETRNLFIKFSYECLFQKVGNRALSENILIASNEIEKMEMTYTKKQDTLQLPLINKKIIKRYTDPIESLIKNGYMLVKVLETSDLQSYQTNFLNTIESFPEYKRNPTSKSIGENGFPILYTLGGFAAFGNPASFHNNFVRNLRINCRNAVVPIFKRILTSFGGHYGSPNKQEFKFEMLIDRMMYRYESMSPSAESWHRDVMPANRILDDDELYGGWINLDNQPQFFSCILGSHLNIKQKEVLQGFDAAPLEYKKILSNKKSLVEIPPGYMIVFPQYIMHEVLGKQADRNMMRLFTGWRLTRGSSSLYQRQEFDDFAVISLPGGMKPPMYSKQHMMSWMNKEFTPIRSIPAYTITVNSWMANTFQDFMFEKNKDGTESEKIPRHLNSLKSYTQGMDPHQSSSLLECCPPYTYEEISLYTPLSIADNPRPPSRP